MPEIDHDRISGELPKVAMEFSAVEHIEDKHIPLHGPQIVYTYTSPERGVEQGMLCIFKVGEVPAIAMTLEKLGDRIRVQTARLTEARVEVFHQGNMFTDLINNYVDQML